MAQKRKLDYYDDDFDFDTESLSSFESDEDFVHSISSSEDNTSDEEDFSSVRQWRKIDSSFPASSRFSFTGDVSMKACVTNTSDPLEYFRLFFTDEFVNHIVTETNIFAAENANKFKSKEHSRTHHWSETNANKLRVFFATLILLGIIMKSTVVLTLSKPLLNKGYCLTMDNYYNSPELGEMLLKSKTDFSGILRPNRKDLPKELKTEKLKKGDLLAYQKEKPKIVLDYNNTMGNVDRMDQQIGYYDLTRSRQRKYHKKIFPYLLDITIFNAFQLWGKKGN
ncbi:piggyBac transposable element-derived protein 4 [Trichonephila clavipes]|nr:piggyBac transposable element-derived protein 4 [Trichonephila clavipes]